MPLASYSVERYRSFVRRTTVSLKPLTLLFGYNSAGKSALLRALPLLAASSGGASLGPLALDAEVAREAAYSDIRSRLTKRNELVFAAAWDDGERGVREVEIQLRAEEKDHLVSALVARDEGGHEVLRVTDVPGQPGRYQIADHTVSLSFDGVCPEVSADSVLPAATRALLDTSAERLASLPRSVHWLGAVRSSPRRKAAYRSDPQRIGGAGERAADKLAYDFQGPKKLFPHVAAGFREMFGHGLEVRDDGEEYALQLALTEDGPVRVSIVDAGEGATQVLPVLVLGAMARAGELEAGAVLAIEQPEMHLHPQAEQVLAKYLCGITRAPSRPQLLIETHSENLLLFVQLEVASGRISPEDVAILWVETLPDGQSVVNEVRLDSQGRPSGWPPGVFSEDVEMARQLFLARKKPQP